ncbi:conserved hypothetical protein [Leishmania infantum JPCM5]|uniref:Uncharacterized protein n=2 Tax=Leishmania infantum TaxID=5671 RepID=A4HWT5_LEIIN|nr:conserved hypothetical protein [Leishmania infantum JPCM5]CAC9474495.1 hypothetical_protein_-_conserved [Leishmania infantum]CAM66915.2 conserved hypothetical protein [Leishmania infantum JPCM5]SUZ40614.1 hypothetical_protein_-_conserved [Leishmania infantum]|eukprot:XP_001464526.2 conserved hypothetical protein [Leishmania infantum JPCM5]
MENIGADRFLVLSGEFPGEGVWCWARTYTELVECVRSAWGSDFRPVFKYKLPCILTDANAHTRREVAEEKPPPQEAALIEEAVSAGLSASTPRKTRPSTCLVVLNDADDFHLWRRGGAYVSAADTTASLAAKTRDVRGDFVHHHGSPAGSAEEIMHTVAHHMDYHRLASEARTADASATATATATTAAAREEGHKERVWNPCPLTSTLYAFRSGAPTTGFLNAPQRQCNGSSVSSERVRTRASPPVRRADADVIQVPLQCILDPALILRLNVTVVLRHSAAPAEVVLFSSHTPSGQGSLPWGALCVKARNAWGVHAPQFRYVDLTNGVTQLLINHVNDYRAWWQQMRLTNCELLVVEQAPSVTSGSAFASAEAQTAIGRYYEEEWPVERYSSSKNVVELVRELKALEREERMAAVQRLGRAVKAPVNGALTASTRAATPRRLTHTSCDSPKIDAASAPSSETAAVASIPTLAESRTLDPYRPLLLQKPQKPLLTTSTPSHGLCCSTPPTVLSTATTPSRAPWTIEEKIDEEMRCSLLNAERYARLINFVSPEHPDTVAVSSGSDPELRASSERVTRSPGDAETPLRRSRQWLFAKLTSPEPKAVAAKATTGHANGQARTPSTAACKDAAGAAATANGVSHLSVAAMNEPMLDAHVRARLHNALLSHHFRTHLAYPVSARGIGATPIW